jgi:hypothetical protein
MVQSTCPLEDAWVLRNTVAEALMHAELHMQRLIAAASVDQLVALVEMFSPMRSLGPEWTRSFEPLVERIWAWAEPAALAALEATLRARGPAWAAVANDFTPERGAELRARLRHPAWARLPAFTLM